MKKITLGIIAVLLLGITFLIYSITQLENKVSLLSKTKGATDVQSQQSNTLINNVAHSREELCLPGSYSPPTVAELSFDKRVAQDGFVTYLRQSLNAYLAKSYAACSAANCPLGLLDGVHYPDSAVSELDALPPEYKDYLQSKFVVLSTDIAPGGGESIVIIFKDKPDILFYAWVYGYHGHGFDLRGFSVYDPAKNGAPSILETQKTYIDQLCNEALGI